MPEEISPFQETGDYSDDLQDILLERPSWLVRRGIAVVFGVLIALLVLSYFIRYPDVITTPVELTAKNPSAELVARADGKLASLLVADGDTVASGAVLAMIKNPVALDDYLRLKQLIGRIEENIEQPSNTEPDVFYQRVVVGEFQDQLSRLTQDIKAWTLFRTLAYFPRKIEVVERQLSLESALSEGLKRQKEFSVQEVDLASKSRETGKSLKEKGLVSDIEFLSYESALLQKKSQLQAAENALVSHELRLAEYGKTILELKKQQDEQEQQLVTSVRESVRRLKSAMESWAERYLIVAPFEGRISTVRVWSENQWVSAQTELFKLTPASQEIIGKIRLKSGAVGKVRIGQKVLIKFDAYPFREFGMAEGVISSVADVAAADGYGIDVHLPNGLTTSYGRKLEFKEGMVGTADIVTEDMRLIGRVFQNLRSLIFN